MHTYTAMSTTIHKPVKTRHTSTPPPPPPPPIFGPQGHSQGHSGPFWCCLLTVLLVSLFSTTEAMAQNTKATGGAVIGDDRRVGATLTADISTIEDADGLPTDASAFSYQWLALGLTPIANANSTTYTLTEDNVGGPIYLDIRFTDLQNNAEDLLLAALGGLPVVRRTNTPPTTSGLEVTVFENTPYTFAAGNPGFNLADDFNFNDVDIGDSLQQVRIDSLPAPANLGDLRLNGAPVTVAQVIAVADIPTLVYTPAADTTGTATFTYSVSDGTDFSVAPAMGTLNIVTTDSPPTSSGLAVTVFEGTAHNLGVAEFNFADADGATLHSLRIDSLPAAGLLSLNNTPVIAGQVLPVNLLGILFYHPAMNSAGTVDTFTYSVFDGTDFSAAPATATLNIVATGTPTTRDLTVTTLEDTAYTFKEADFTFRNGGASGSLQAVRIDTLPASTSGSLALNGTAVTARQVIPVAGIPNLVYTPALNVNGDATFTFSVSDGTDFSVTATATVSVNQANDAPTADAGLDQTVAEGASVTLDGSRSDDPDGDNSALICAWRQVGTPTVTLTGADTFAPTFTAPANLLTNVVLVFSLTVNDGVSDSVADTVTITTSKTQAFTDLNNTILPEVARALTNQTVDAITQRMDQVRTGANQSLTFAGQSSLAGVATAHGQGIVDGTLDVKAMLGNSGFALPLNAVDGTGGGGTSGGIGGSSLTFWGGGDYRDFEGSGNGVDFDGDLFSAQLGVDGKLRDDLLIGVAASWSESDIDYRGDSGHGEHQLEITTLHPYASWETLSGLDLWATAGFGQGDLEITDGQGRASSDVETRMLGAGGNYQLPGTTIFRLKGSGVLSDSEVKGNGRIAALKTDSSLLRMALEGSHRQMLSGEAYLEQSFEAGARYDGGGDTGFGFELGTGWCYADPAVGLNVEGNVRTLLGRADYQEWGVSGRILLQTGSDGRGLSFSMSPVYGNAASGTQTLWQDGLFEEISDEQDNDMRMETRLGYGLTAPGGHGLLAPYAEMTSSNSAQRYRLGMNWGVDSLFDLNLVGERSESAGGAEHAILLKGIIRL